MLRNTKQAGEEHRGRGTQGGCRGDPPRSRRHRRAEEEGKRRPRSRSRCAAAGLLGRLRSRRVGQSHLGHCHLA
eukprot:scaffold193783_cov30-Tisochrysis_lutea.AAC.3